MEHLAASKYDTLYYFGNNEDSDGALKTGNVSVSLDGDSYQFQFSKTGGAEGRAVVLTVLMMASISTSLV